MVAAYLHLAPICDFRQYLDCLYMDNISQLTFKREIVQTYLWRYKVPTKNKCLAKQSVR